MSSEKNGIEKIIEKILLALGVGEKDVRKMIAVFESKESKKSSNYAEYKIAELLTEIGVPSNVYGYTYLKCAILFAQEHPNCSAYPAVAEKFNTTIDRIERAVRYAIEVAWDRGDIAVFEKYFKNSINPQTGKPTQRQFINRIAEISKVSTS